MGPAKTGPLIRWDLSPLSAGGVVTGASITVNVSNPSTGQFYNLYAAQRNWIENEVNWNNYASGAPWETAGADGAGDRDNVVLGTAVSSALGKVTFQLNAAGFAQLQQWISAPGYQFRVSLRGPIVASTTRRSTRGGRGRQPLSSRWPTLLRPPRIRHRRQRPRACLPPTTAKESRLNWTAATDPETGILNYGDLPRQRSNPQHRP